ncbi:short chain enoyl-CoA hydratase [Schinkia azotoformans MEV2011]|uniref:Short chain enoyl-CoA hydratase n=1 Tax=Schinkia azotoformans MEV2011 TaxID=1348973 RepID=A0A072NGF5_SCHAZ|nr:enoyl-CoA hydratase-related protein [Schinkia azotoformans]KEF36337.1 short chain enoyl-CoA hydratase [Schinkia azotoformans MEV2011]MEC1696729.1 enoyl-CoA hydratase-related protein [Schinkia azotoformans]MEC1723617.1 enoyl-CoA hydratase-related protein [Schinkia azotoformans]MEC1771083.1 enoyl-CoA hydratase-related protein [Schinkia azotoformans]MEC1781853.1 enoyl-CoA hydratase-related protein [Schinkia azotoformans]
MNKVHLLIEDQIAFITIDVPPVNALNEEVLHQLSKALDDISNSEIDVVIISGAGKKAFVAGADIREFPTLNKDTGEALCRRGQSVFTKIEGFPQPVIAAIDGFTLGGGLELALACDFRIASKSSTFGLPEVKLGILPGYGGTQRLARLIGIGKAKQIIYSGEFFTAEEAFKFGLIEEITDESPLEKAKEWAEKIKQRGPLAVEFAKKAINIGIDLPLEEGLEWEARFFGELCETADKNEGVTAFLEKRQPKFLKR